MKTVTVQASTNYSVIVGQNLLAQTGEYIIQISKPCKVAVISDSNVFPIYGNILENSLTSSGFRVCHYVFSAGESQKNSTTYLEILNFLAENTFTRSDMIIALGGGVTGDIAGFAAATYLRGIPYVQIPTSLLAMVDSSVGGKTAIDLKYGKNLAGAFYQPEFVLCDIDSLQTLPEEFFTDGMAEVIKYAMIYDESMESLICGGAKDNIQNLIARCIEIKSEIVHLDEFEGGLRKILNFGHTAGHGVEARSEYTISHRYNY